VVVVDLCCWVVGVSSCFVLFGFVLRDVGGCECV